MRGLGSERAGSGLNLDAIVVPTTSPVDETTPAIVLGNQADVPVVVMGGNGGNGGEVRDHQARVLPANCIVVDFSEELPESFPVFETSTFFDGTIRPPSDLSHKRNLGLTLARLAGWRAVLFLDDDIEMLDPFHVHKAAASLDPNIAVGLPVWDFPDNSIVCHANRLWRDRRQKVFVGGAALVVDVPTV